MSTAFRYPQFCPVARAAEVLAERWTPLLVRELSIGPQRWSDLRRRLAGISPSVLATRLAHLEQHGVVERRTLPPPAASQVYELGEAGRALWPLMVELTRWGVRYLRPPRDGDQLEPDWVRLGLRAFARREATPAFAFELRIPDEPDDCAIHVIGGPGGTRVRDEAASAPDASVRAPPMVLLGIVGGGLRPADCVRDGSIEVRGDVGALDALPSLFEVSTPY